MRLDYLFQGYCPTDRPACKQGEERWGTRHSFARFKTYSKYGSLKHQIFTFVIYGLLLMNSASSSASTNSKLVEHRNVFFDRIGTADGLSTGQVAAITQDRYGFIWIGTQEGLNRFDGYDFQTYYHMEGDDASLSHSQIRSLLADSQGRLWVGTDAGLNLFDESNRTFSLVDLKEGEEGNKIKVFALLEDSKGDVWIGTSLGLCRLSRDGHLSNYRHDVTNRNSLGKGNVRTILESSDGTIWVGIENGGLDKLDPVSGRAIHFTHDPEDEQSLSSDNVRKILEDDEGRLWIATFNAGISIYNPMAESWERIVSIRDDVTSLGSKAVFTLFKDQSGEIWAGTANGLSLWLPGSNKFIRYVADLTDARSISHNSVFSLFQDHGGVIWAGTINGINKWNANIDTFPHFKQQGTNPTGLSSISITSFAEATDGNVWIGTFQGLLFWDAGLSKLETVSTEKLGLSDYRIMSLMQNDGELWMGTMGGGVSLLKANRVIRTFVSDPGDASSISSNAVSSLFQDSKQQIWLTTYGGGVNRYLGDGKFKQFPDDSNPYGAFDELRTLDILEASDGRFWIATDGGGVTVLNPDSGDTSSYRHIPGDSGSLSSDNVMSLLKTDKAIWVGTRDRGMNRYDAATGKFKRYSKRNGLASDSVWGMLEDKEGRIWISGAKGLSVLEPETGIFKLYDSTHGLQSDDFNSGAYLELTDGRFIFGGNNGFNAFDPGQFIQNHYVPPIRLTNFSKFNKTFNLDKAIYRTSLIELEYTDSVIGFGFAALDYTAPRKNRYKYMLEGFDPDWVDAGTVRQATYTNLDAGTYVFRVKGSNNDGVWNEEGTKVTLIVHPPVWATWWAYLLYAAALITLVYQLLQVYTHRQQREAEKRYSERLQLYIESLEEATDCVLIADNRGRLLYANNATRSILGQTPAESIGRSLVSVVFENEEDSEKALLALEEHGRYHGEVTYVADNGESLTTEVTIAAVRELSEHGSAYVSISRDITLRKKTEAELENHRRNLEFLVAERTSALEREIAENKATQRDLANSLEEKELLLKEVHHRVKNNMQVISSLLNIQAETAGNEVFSNLLGESQQRIKSMSLIHENLYQSENLQEIDFEDYINMLANSLCRFYSVPGVSILLDIQVDHVALDLETAVPCGLIINEIISNSLKHAFKGREGTGTISIALTKTKCNYVLEIKDDGCGLPEDFQLETATSMGIEIVSILTQQLDGKIRTFGTEGAGFEIRFPIKEKHAH